MDDNKTRVLVNYHVFTDYHNSGQELTEIQLVEQNLFLNDWRPFIQLLLLKLKLFELFQTKLKRQRKFVIIFFILNNMMSFYQDIHRDKIHLNL